VKQQVCMNDKSYPERMERAMNQMDKEDPHA
jgi:hypothetical protein